MIGDHTIDLFRHPPVKAPQSGFDMCNRNMKFGCCQCASKRGIGITIDDNPIWALFQEHLFNRFEHTSRLDSMSSRPYPQMVVRCGNGKFIEELGGHVIIVVLPRMNNKFLVLLPYRATYR